MGCSDSKSAETQSRTKSAPTPKGTEDIIIEDVDEESKYLSAEEAIEFINKELAELILSETRTKALVERLDKKKDGRIAKADLESLKEQVFVAKKDIVPLFEAADPDGDGSVPLQDGAVILARKFPLMKPEALKGISERFDTNNDGQFQYGEFVIFYSHCKSKENRFKAALDNLNVNETGTINKEEVINVLVTECELDVSEAQTLTEQHDCDNDGMLSKEEFEHMWNSMFDVPTNV